MGKKASGLEREAHRAERGFYDMTGGENVYKYITTEGKVTGKKAGKITALEYLQKSTGVFNGDIGSICKILPDKLCVDFDGRTVEYSKTQLGDLELAYAITIHKSQGSEYPAVVLPILSGPRPLMNRNILYTAVTRGKKCVTIVGNKDTVREMIQNKSEQMRYSSLCRRLQELEQESLEK